MPSLIGQGVFKIVIWYLPSSLPDLVPMTSTGSPTVPIKFRATPGELGLKAAGSDHYFGLTPPCEQKPNNVPFRMQSRTSTPRSSPMPDGITPPLPDAALPDDPGARPIPSRSPVNRSTPAAHHTVARLRSAASATGASSVCTSAETVAGCALTRLDASPWPWPTSTTPLDQPTSIFRATGSTH